MSRTSRPPRLSPRAERVLEFAALAVVLAVAAFLRIRRMSELDIFEDGYHHWLIGSHWALTGAYVDPMSMMTNGNWLPGYYPLVGALDLVAGWGALTLLRVVSLLCSLGTTLLVYAMARPAGRLAALFASLFLGLAIQDALIGSMALPESIVVLSVTASIYLLFFARRPESRIRYVAASLLLLLAVTLRYEAWIVAVLLPLYGWLERREEFRRLVLVALPAWVFAIAWVVALLPQGSLPAIVFGQTAREAQNEIALGNEPATPWGRLWWFWIENYGVGLLPLFVLGPAYMVLRQRRELGTWIALVLFAGVSVMVAAGAGTGSYRYVAIAVPFLAVAAGRMAAALVRRAGRAVGAARPRAGPAVVAALSVLLVTASLANTAWITPRLDGVGQLNAPLERAGVWVSGQSWPTGKRLLSDSPIAAYYSNVDPVDIWSSFWLPDNRTQALAVLHAEYAYVIFVNVSYYPLRQLFPELQRGVSTQDFTLAYNPNGWEEQYGAKQVFVYEVRT